VIPRELFRKIRRIEIRTKGLVNEVFGGEYHSAFRGRGIEFSEVRPYQIGDDVRTIDWNVSARTGETYVKLFEEEREQTLLLAVDVSGSETFGTGGVLKREVAAEICAVLAFSAVRNNDKVGLLLFSDRVERFVPPRKGRRHALRLVRDLFAHEPASTGTDLAGAFDHLVRALRRRAIVIAISDFLDEGYERRLRALSGRHDVVAIHLSDPREEELPAAGLLTLRDAETGQPILVDTSSRRVREAFAQRAAERRRATEAALRSARVDTIAVRTDEDYVEPLVAFFRRRNRRG
jgi:uncharacterized protein (DUF58 family)